jgi:hypothetical protein
MEGPPGPELVVSTERRKRAMVIPQDTQVSRVEARAVGDEDATPARAILTIADDSDP